ncbi:MAG: cytochrome [Variovorax sp.]|nr:cytochrome [Variovorax sp.]
MSAKADHPNHHMTSPSLNLPAANVETVWRYGRTAIVLHWTLAVLLTFMIGLGWYMMSIEREAGSAWYFNLHKSVGLVIALLVAVGVAWRSGHRPESLPVSVPRWQARLAFVTQTLLYALMVLMPVTGYLGASHSKAGVQLFGLPTPRWAVPDHDRAEQFYNIHSVLVWVLVALVVLHVAGALKHLLWDKDGVFQRMWFRSGS